METTTKNTCCGGKNTLFAKTVRWTVLFCVLLLGFASPFSPQSCSVAFSVGFPLPYYFLGVTQPEFTWPISTVLSLGIDVLVTLILSALFWRLQAKLINRKIWLTGLRLAIAYGILGSLTCFAFYFLDTTDIGLPQNTLETFIVPGAIFYTPFFWLEDFLKSNFSPSLAVVYARVLLLPTLVAWTLVFVALAKLFRIISGLFSTSCKDCPP